jgi:hypothetical protein
MWPSRVGGGARTVSLEIVTVLICIRARAAFGLGESLCRMDELGVRSGSLAMKELPAIKWEVTDSNGAAGIRVGTCERNQFEYKRKFFLASCG